MLVIPPLVSNVELVWEHAYYRRFLEYYACYMRMTIFDKRGVGLSDRFADAPTLEERTEDILAVLDAASLETVVLEGVSEGGLMAQLFAALHPERVERLVLFNSSPGAAGSWPCTRHQTDPWHCSRRSCKCSSAWSIRGGGTHSSWLTGSTRSIQTMPRSCAGSGACSANRQRPLTWHVRFQASRASMRQTSLATSPPRRSSCTDPAIG